jgi:uncharacterized protein (DUF433 family)
MDTALQTPGSLDRYIVSTPDVMGGKPHIAGHRIAVTHIKAWRLARGMAESEIAEAFDLPLPAPTDIDSRTAVHARAPSRYTHVRSRAR